MRQRIFCFSLWPYILSATSALRYYFEVSVMLDFLFEQLLSLDSALIAAFLSAALSLMGMRLGVLTRGGALAAFATGFGVLCLEQRLFPPLFSMVVLGEASTRIRVRMDLLRARAARGSVPSAHESGSRSGESQIDAAISAGYELQIKKLHKPRGAGSVIGNGGVALLFAIAAGIASLVQSAGEAAQTGTAGDFRLCLLLFAAASGALAAAAADTVSGEIGRALRAKAVLITTFKPVEIGANGGVSLTGTIAGIAAAGFIGCIAALFAGFRPEYAAFSPKFALFVAISGALGGAVDSVLGATAEGRQIGLAGLRIALGNDGVNFLCTLVGALFAAVFIAVSG